MKMSMMFLLASAAYAQLLDLSSLDKLASKANETTSVNFDAAKLKFASQFLSSDEESQAKAKDLISGLRGIFVRAFEFDGDGGHSSTDLEPLRKQLTAPGWSNIVTVKEKRESTEVWLFNKGDQIDGIAVIAVEPDEIAVINIVGPVDINALRKLSGSFGIPDIDTDLIRKAQPKPAPAKPTAKPKKENDDE
jgi:hypothetical protein